MNYPSLEAAFQQASMPGIAPPGSPNPLLKPATEQSNVIPDPILAPSLPPAVQPRREWSEGGGGGVGDDVALGPSIDADDGPIFGNLDIGDMASRAFSIDTSPEGLAKTAAKVALSFTPLAPLSYAWTAYDLAKALSGDPSGPATGAELSAYGDPGGPATAAEALAGVGAGYGLGPGFGGGYGDPGGPATGAEAALGVGAGFGGFGGSFGGSFGGGVGGVGGQL